MPTIALVDDDRNILTSVSIALEAEGYRIMTYTDGASALEGFKTSPPDLAILDIKMPRMDGMELLRRLRQKSDVPVIFLTSKDEEIDELFGLKMGADDFIKKPFSQRLLVERVKSVLRRAVPKDGTAPKELDAKAIERDADGYLGQGVDPKERAAQQPELEGPDVQLGCKRPLRNTECTTVDIIDENAEAQDERDAPAEVGDALGRRDDTATHDEKCENNEAHSPIADSPHHGG